jgi:HlyD family secretion protein
MTEADVKAPKTAMLPAGILKSRYLRLAVMAIGMLLVANVTLGILKPAKSIEYRTEAVRRTDVTRAVSASGELEAVDSVTIGSEISGQVQDVLVDFNDTVKKDQLLAVINTETYQARVQQAQAQVDSAAADARVSQADYDRQKRLFEGGLVAEKTMQDAAATRDRSNANLRQAQASLASAKNDLSKANIRSPIDGIVVNRTVDPGQTVAASLNAPELFVIAKDLSKMQISIQVDEADIGQVKEGQVVRFTVDAFPDDTFEGRVTQVRKQPEKTANVVTYVVIAQADNPQRKLLPGMTANADIIIEDHPNVLAAPSSALRYLPAGAKPTQTASAAGAGPAAAGGGFGAGGGGFGAGAGGGGGRAFGGGQMSIDQNPMFKDLALDAKQKDAIKSINEGMRPKAMQLFAQAGGDRQKMREGFEKLRKDSEEQIAAILRPDQRAKYQAKLAEMQAAFAGGGGRPARGERLQKRTIYVLENNKPKAVEVEVGATDGTLMQVAGPNIKEGMLVITSDNDKKNENTQQSSRGFNSRRMIPFGGP